VLRLAERNGRGRGRQRLAAGVERGLYVEGDRARRGRARSDGRAHAAAGLPSDICNHSFRATGLTLHRKNGSDIRRTQELAGHADISTTMFYDHSGDEIARTEVELVSL
jgi:site-specific recombinase XerD